jgi:hypothetical protein
MARLPALFTSDQYFEMYPTSDPDEHSYIESVYERHPMVAHHPNFAMFMHTPRLADLMMNLTNDIVQMDWVQTPQGHLSILVCDRRLHSEDSYMAHLSSFLSAGMTWAQIATMDIPDSTLFDDEERMVMEFTHTAIDGRIPDDLFAKARSLYGDKTMVEWAISLAFWTFYPYFINALQADADTRPATLALWRGELG